MSVTASKINMASPLTVLKGVGPRMSERLQKLGLQSIADVLFHLPLRYQDRTRVASVGALRPAEEVVIEVEVQASDIQFGRRRSLLCRVSDGTGSMMLRFFHFSASQRAGLERGTRLRCFGEVRKGPSMLEMVHPEYQRISTDAEMLVEASLTPVYPAVEGISQKTLRPLVLQALQILKSGEIEDLLPAKVVAAMGLPSLQQALTYVHQPPPETSVFDLLNGHHPAQQRLAFEELLAHHLVLRQLRIKAQKHAAPVLAGPGRLFEKLMSSLAFELTSAQGRVIDEIFSDMAQPFPMQRLVQGDVGSGKTVVAAAAVVQAIEAGFQVAVMAPTELLAEQHFNNFNNWLQPMGINIAWLAGKQGAAERREMLSRLQSGESRLVIGTHALFQQEVDFYQLGLIVVDEQHRFGVHQRLALREKGRHKGMLPHQLIMTATPIPRTLAMTAYADLDTSVIDELPPGRKPIETVVVPEERRPEVVERVRNVCQQGQQAYWVCTLIEESEALQCQAAEDTAVLLAEALPDLKVGLVHGRLKSAEKEAIMAQFKAAEINLLVATTVVEVGVDVPNASLMIVENAERLGLAQLHQLRGRVGRGSVSSCCVLMYHKPLSQRGRTRLAALRETNDGFEIARRDLELRGPGEVLGTRQSGMLRLRIADLERDKELLTGVAQMATQLLSDWPERVPLLIARWLGDARRYGDV